MQWRLTTAGGGMLPLITISGQNTGLFVYFFLFLQGKVVLMSKNGSIRWSKVTHIKLLKRSVFVG